MAPPSAAAALRESFGDRKLPDISRKITACVACRKAKIKCYMTNSKPPCSRCTARGLPCTVNKSIQMLLENDAGWKEAMERRVEELEQALISGGNRNPRRPSTNLASLALAPSTSPRNTERAIARLTSPVEAFSETPRDVTLNLSCSLGAFPASSLNDSSSDHGSTRPDLISSGIISRDNAENLFKFYQEKLNPYIHYVVSENDSLADVRTRSPLLITAICSTAALCSGSADYKNCFNTYMHEASDKLFSVHHSFDDVRALCIGALWLNDISSTLLALAVRLAAELNLHRCITKMPHSKRACYERTRLYFVLYIVDHHCSLSHGRPPMTRPLSPLKSQRAMLQSQYSSPKDLNLISQLELWSISGRVFDIFGADIESSFDQIKSAELQRLSNTYDQWYREWLDILTLREVLDQFAQHVFSLYYYSAKLYLFSHVFRGPAQKDLIPPVTTNGVDDVAQRAVEQAISIVRCISDGMEKESRLTPGNLPGYFCTVTAFACVLLLRVSWLGADHIVDKEDVFNSLHRLIESIQTSSFNVTSVHSLLNIANSLKIAIGGRDQVNGEGAIGNASQQLIDTSSLDFNLFGEDLFGLSFVDDHTNWLDIPDLDGPGPSTLGIP